MEIRGGDPPVTVPELCQRVLSRDRVIAVVGWSAQPERASHEVSAYMHAHGYRIVGVNPAYAGCSDAMLAGPCYDSLALAAQALAEQGRCVEMVNVFRRIEAVPAVVSEALAIGPRSLWLQLGVVHDAAACEARQAGLDVVMDRCLKIDHAALSRAGLL